MNRDVPHSNVCNSKTSGNNLKVHTEVGFKIQQLHPISADVGQIALDLNLDLN